MWVDTLPGLVQFIAVFILGVIPVIEGDIAAAIGIAAGVSWPLMLIAAAGGTAVATLVAVDWGERISSAWRKRRAAKRFQAESNERRAKLLQRV